MYEREKKRFCEQLDAVPNQTPWDGLHEKQNKNATIRRLNLLSNFDNTHIWNVYKKSKLHIQNTRTDLLFYTLIYEPFFNLQRGDIVIDWYVRTLRIIRHASDCKSQVGNSEATTVVKINARGHFSQNNNKKRTKSDRIFVWTKTNSVTWRNAL